MERTTVTFTAREAAEIEETRVWYEEYVGVRVSKNSMIKKLLFECLTDFRSKVENDGP